MYPVKVYDKHGNLIKEYTQDELNKRSDELFAKVLDDLKKGTNLCKPAPSDLKSEKVPHSGKSKDTTGESGKE